MPRLSTKTWDRYAPITRKQYVNISGNAAGAGFWMPQLANGPQKINGDIVKLRALRSAIPWLAAGIDIRCEGIAQAEWTIASTETENPGLISKALGLQRRKGLSDAQSEIAQATVDFLHNPDPNGVTTSWTRLVRPVWEDTYINGKGCIRKFLDEQRMIQKLRVYDARRVRRNPKWDPDDLEQQQAKDKSGYPVMPRYYYLAMDPQTGRIDETKGEPLFSEELALIEPSPVSYQDDGLSPVLAIEDYIQAHQDVFASVWDVQKSGQPPGLFKIPSAQAGTIQRLTDMWRQRGQGQSSALFASLPADADWIAMGDTNLTARGAFTFFDILVRGVAASLRISTVALGWTQTTLERNASEQGEYQDDGLINALRLTQGVFNTEIIPFMPGTEGMEMRYDGISDDDEAEGAEAINAWTGGKVMLTSIDQLCVRAGLPLFDRPPGSPLDMAYTAPWVLSGGSFVPLPLALGLTPNQPVAGYDPETGEVDQAEAAKQNAAAMAAQQQAMGGAAPGTGSGDPSGDDPSGDGSNGGPNGGANGGGVPPNMLRTMQQAKSAIDGAGDPEIAAAVKYMDEHLAAIYPRE